MPKATRVHRYPTQYFDIAQQLESKDRLVLRCSDEKAAKSLRLDLYGFRAAMAKEGMDMFPAIQRAILRVKENDLEIITPEEGGIRFTIDEQATVHALPHPLPTEFHPSLADAPPSSTYQSQEVVNEFESLVDAWMHRASSPTPNSPGAPTPDSEINPGDS